MSQSGNRSVTQPKPALRLEQNNDATPRAQACISNAT
jgi:hypothetical protein